MNILIAPNTMKGSLSATDFATAVEKAFAETCPGYFQSRKIPVADGGDETADILINALGLKRYSLKVKDPLNRETVAVLGYANGTAVIEMAAASGMRLLEKSELNPLKTSSFGTGQLILEAVKLGAKKIFLGVGGSATVDGGLGTLEAMGLRFKDKNGNLLHGNGENMLLIERIDSTNMADLESIEIKIISDVDNPLLGANGASCIFAPQKGATAEMVRLLEIGLENLEKKIAETTGISAAGLKGSGAAGGITVGLVAFFGAEIVPGADFILNLLNFEEHLLWADVVVTGEGKLDHQSLQNKAPFVVARKAKEKGKPVYAIVGVNELNDTDIFEKVYSLTEAGNSMAFALTHTEELVREKTVELAKFLR